MRNYTCSPGMVVHISLVRWLSWACILIHNVFFVSQDYVIGWWQQGLVLTPGNLSLATLTARYISKDESNPEWTFYWGSLRWILWNTRGRQKRWEVVRLCCGGTYGTLLGCGEMLGTLLACGRTNGMLLACGGTNRILLDCGGLYRCWKQWSWSKQLVYTFNTANIIAHKVSYCCCSRRWTCWGMHLITRGFLGTFCSITSILPLSIWHLSIPQKYFDLPKSTSLKYLFLQDSCQLTWVCLIQQVQWN